jgi:hypothetical protein
MNRILALAATAVIVLATSGADAGSLKHRVPRGVHGLFGADPTLYLQYLPRLYPGLAPSFGESRAFMPYAPEESPMFAPDAPSPRRYDNPGIPDFQTGSRS